MGMLCTAGNGSLVDCRGEIYPVETPERLCDTFKTGGLQLSLPWHKRVSTLLHARACLSPLMQVPFSRVSDEYRLLSFPQSGRTGILICEALHQWRETTCLLQARNLRWTWTTASSQTLRQAELTL